MSKRHRRPRQRFPLAMVMAALLLAGVTIGSVIGLGLTSGHDATQAAAVTTSFGPGVTDNDPAPASETESGPPPEDVAFYEVLVTQQLSSQVGGSITNAAQLGQMVCTQLNAQPDIHGAYNAQGYVRAAYTYGFDQSWHFTRLAVDAYCPGLVTALP